MNDGINLKFHKNIGLQLTFKYEKTHYHHEKMIIE